MMNATVTARTDAPAGEEELRGRVNLLNWDGKGVPPGMFPKDPDDGATVDEEARR